MMDLRAFSLFDSISDTQLTQCVVGEPRTLQPGEHLFREGDWMREFFLVVEGTLQVYRLIQGNRTPVSGFVAGQFGGEVPILSGTPHLANGVATSELKLFVMDEEAFWSLMHVCPGVREKILANMAHRMQELQTMSSQREKLVALGTMSAGLAHEINNPASAAKRAAQTLCTTLDEFGRHAGGMFRNVMFKPSPELSAQPFEELRGRFNPEGFDLDPIRQGELEDDLTDWLEELEVEDPWEAAAAYIGGGYTREHLEGLADQLKPEYIAPFLRWVSYEVEMRQLAYTLAESSARVSTLVVAMKQYSYMDRDLEKADTDLHDGLHNTLVILKHKFKKKAITVSKEYAADVPPVPAFGAELNQVWTNLLVNALDVLPADGTGRITLRTFLDPTDPNLVTVEVEDNGRGIPPDVLPRIFEPFFTTKGVGKGTGMGLDITHRIVVNNHGGTITVDSEPGRTTFRVCLPVQAEVC